MEPDLTVRADDEPEEEEEDEEAGSGMHKQLAEKLLQSRKILLSEPISAELAEHVVAKLLVLDEEDPKAPIDIYINSPGGSVDAGYAMFDMIRYVSAPIRCISNGLCASAAVIVLLAADRKNRFSLPSSRFLLHQPSGGARGSTADIEIEANEILKIRARINVLIAEETGQPVETVEDQTRRNYWMDAAEAAKYGLVAKVISAKKELK